MRTLLYMAALLLPLSSFCQLTSYRQNQTPEYDEVVATYTMLDKKYEQAQLIEYGMSDGGRPIHLFVINANRVFTAEAVQKDNPCIILINNGIHPGEPDGINASIEFAADLLSQRIRLPTNIVIAIVPLYNVDGAVNRSCCSRFNQNGPQEYGFRANATNLDLNRDFIKADSENTKTFIKMFHEWKPDIFIDTHVSNGADYQHVMTLIETQKDKMNRITGGYMQNNFTPLLYKGMEDAGFPMCPYVNVWNGTPDKGYEGFLETPRYATGYTSLFNTLSYVTESHMLKPFPQRVEATYAFFFTTMNAAAKECSNIKDIRKLAQKISFEQKQFALNWTVDTTHCDSILFKGYEGEYRMSNVTGLDRLQYNRNKPYEKKIPFYNTYRGMDVIEKPKAYVFPKAWKPIAEKLLLNKVIVKQVTKDTLMNVSSYYIRNYKSSPRPYEGHHLKTNVELEKTGQQIQFYNGDYVVECNQETNRFIIEALEPQGSDSWFAWGFFDAILQQKEWFSDYIYIDEAEKMLAANAALKDEFEKKKLSDKEFASDSWAMLTWIYHRSPNFEKTYNRYPVFRLE